MAKAYHLSFDDPIDPCELAVLYGQTSWAVDRKPGEIQKMLDGSYLRLGVWEDGRLIGFGRVVSDGVYRALFDDIIVDESRRGRGIGRLIMERLLSRTSHIEGCFLGTGPHMEGFYEQFGFARSDGFHMDLRKRK